MKKIMSLIGIFVLALTLVIINGSDGGASNLCFLCGSGSSCEQCVSSSGSDTQNDRKICEQKGCKVSGYTSCSSAANIKFCR